MKLPLALNYEVEEKKFGGFCVKVLKNELNLIFREEKRIFTHEKFLSEFEDYELNMLIKNDNYDFLENSIQVLQFNFIIKNDLLFEVLKELPEKKREVILMSFWLEMTDVDIAKLLNLSRQNVNYLRKASLKKLYQVLKEAFNELF